MLRGAAAGLRRGGRVSDCLAVHRLGQLRRLLEEGDYTREKKAVQKQDDPLAAFYWSLIVAIYLGLSFFTGDWGRTWIIWPVAAVLFAGVQALRRRA